MRDDPRMRVSGPRRMSHNQAVPPKSFTLAGRVNVRISPAHEVRRLVRPRHYLQEQYITSVKAGKEKRLKYSRNDT